MKIKNILARPGVGAWYVTDLEAVRQGALPDKIGFMYSGTPVTPGFQDIRQPAQAVCVMVVLEDGQIAYGDCATTVFPGRAGRDVPVTPDQMVRIIEDQVAPELVGRDVTTFRGIDEHLASLRVDGRELGPATRYGLSQALLDAAAKARRVPMARVLADEWGTTISTKPIPLNLQTGPDAERGLDKFILRRGDILHTRNPHNEKMFEQVPGAVEYIKDRLTRLAPADYRPTIHLDFYGLMGKVYAGDVGKIVEHIALIERLADPYPVIFGDVTEEKTLEAQVEKMAEIRRAARAAGITGKLLVEEHCLTLEDHKAFIDAGAADYQKVRPLDLGNFSTMMDIGVYVKRERASEGVGIYFTGTGSETETAARVRTHVAMALQADFMLASPGMGLDEAHTVVQNEMTRVLAQVEALAL